MRLKKIRPKDLPGMSSGSPDVFKKGFTRKKDSEFRDVFTQKERGNRLEPTKKSFIYIGAIVATIFSLILLLALCCGVLYFYYTIKTAGTEGMYSGAPTTVSEYIDLVWSTNYRYLIYVISLLIGLAALLYLERTWRVQNVGIVHTDIDQYENDSYIQLPEELAYNYDIFPDVGAHSEVSPTAVLSHIMLNNEAIEKIKVAKRYEENIVEEIDYVDETGKVIETEKVEHKVGDFVYDDEGKQIFEEKKMFDKGFQKFLFTASGIPEGKEFSSVRKVYSPYELLYNPNGKRGKDNSVTVADHINTNWYYPEYEKQRPAGAYIVDTEPNNTMVLAMTRAGKGQSIIEPTIDMWTRERHLNNIAINDPKGELYTKFYYPASKRGFDVIAFNLINPVKTNIYNPLGYAIEAARQGDNQKVEEKVASIGDVFFSTENSDDPMWGDAANATFKRTALGLIDYYQEEENEVRIKAVEENWPESKLERHLDIMWGHVTLYNVYQMMTELASKKSEDLNFIRLGEGDIKKSKDYLTLFFDATNELPKNAIRTSVANQDNSLRAMAGSQKTIASVYGIALTAMLFFADEKISRLTSGRPSQNFDIVGLGFPRRIGVRFDSTFLRKMNFSGQKAVWTAYKDAYFRNQYVGEDFEHETRIDSNGWTYFIFKGIFENPKTYLKLEVFDDVSKLKVKTFYFEFSKGYQKSLNGRTFIKHPVTKERIVLNGLLKELCHVKSANNEAYVVKKTMIKWREKSFSTVEDVTYKKDRIIERPAILQSEVKYSEKPKSVFFITPPHLMSYAKIILILLNQMFNMQVDKAYLTKANQKPLYKTRYMLDEVGNLQSNGNGIPFLNTKESIGLGQDQQYTLILQTLQQLRDVYGESAEKIVQGNTGNIIYLKSTDDSMLDTLEKMSGIKHEAYTDQKTVTEDAGAVAFKNESKVARVTTMKEMPVISNNDLKKIPQSNAIVFGKGNPIWSRNQLIMPRSWALHDEQLRDNDEDYALDTVPTTSNTDEFDVILNKPDFVKMLKKRVAQAKVAPGVRSDYYEVHNMEPDDEIRANPEEISKSFMEEINRRVKAFAEDNKLSENDEFVKIHKDNLRKARKDARKIFANNTISLDQVKQIGERGYNLTQSLKDALIEGYVLSKDSLRQDLRFSVEDNGSLYMYDEHLGEVTKMPLILHLEDNPDDAALLEKLKERANNPKDKEIREIPSENEKKEEDITFLYTITQNFFKYAFSESETDWAVLFTPEFNENCGDCVIRAEK